MAKSLSDIRRLKQLQALVTYHRQLYHTEDTTEISDEAYDGLVRELVALETELLGAPIGVVESVGAAPSAAFTKVRHQVRQWSFDNVFNLAELTAWEERLRRVLEKQGVREPELTYVGEHKIDGLKVVLEYQAGQLVQALTRGDGVVGEDVTHTARTIKSLPATLAEPVDLLCVGEVWLSAEDFQKLNAAQAKAGDAPFANPRNAAAGSLRQLDPIVAAARNLSIFLYDIDAFSPLTTKLMPPTTQAAELALLRTLGLPVNLHSQVCADLAAIEQYYMKWKDSHDDLPYGVDGIVIKLDEVQLQQLAGYTAKSPRFGVAYKFPAIETTTVIESIGLQVGRTGVVTPVAHLRPVLIDGSTVSRATLHNEDQIKRLDVRAGDTVVVRKAGDVIPEVVQIIKELRPKGAKAFHFPKTVAECGGDGRIERVSGTAAYRCVSLESTFLERQKLYYFVGKTAFNIDGVGPKIIDALIEFDLITDAADLFTLTPSDFLELPGFKAKAAQNAYEAIQAARRVTLARLLVALSIEQVGAETAQLLARRFGSVKALQQATYELVEAIHGVGGVVAEAIIAWQRDQKAQALVEKLMTHLELLPETVVSATLAGQSFVFTGTLPTLTREAASDLVRERGGTVSGSVSKQTTYVVAGSEAGSKAEKAASLGVIILDEAAFQALIAQA